MLRDNWDNFIHGREKKTVRQQNYPNRPGFLPTVRDWDEFSAPIHADIIRQVTGGSVAYYGLGSEIEGTPDDRIPAKHSRALNIPEPVDTRDREALEDEEITAAFRRAWLRLNPGKDIASPDGFDATHDSQLRRAFAEAYKKLKG